VPGNRYHERAHPPSVGVVCVVIDGKGHRIGAVDVPADDRLPIRPEQGRIAS